MTEIADSPPLSFRRKPESINTGLYLWMPAFAGMTRSVCGHPIIAKML
jgi:hypothetical protein